jgi:hypothetical protein
MDETVQKLAFWTNVRNKLAEKVHIAGFSEGAQLFE